jgi:hypothetical protein
MEKIGAATFGIMALTITTSSIAIRKCDTQQENIQHKDTMILCDVKLSVVYAEVIHFDRNAEFHDTECRYAE